MTIQELIDKLRELALDGSRDITFNSPVYLHDPSKVYPGSKEDDMFYIGSVEHIRGSSINNPCVEIQIGKGFGW